jgi:hypothetical protein
MGMFTLFVLGSLTSWRTSAGIVAVIPIVTILMLSRVSDDMTLRVVRSIELSTCERRLYPHAWQPSTSFTLGEKKLWSHTFGSSTHTRRHLLQGDPASICRYCSVPLTVLHTIVSCKSHTEKFLTCHLLGT